MPAMPQMMPFREVERIHAFTHDDVVENRRDAADGEAENKALDVETGSLRLFEQAWRVPVFGYKKRLGQAKWCHDQT